MMLLHCGKESCSNAWNSEVSEFSAMNAQADPVEKPVESVNNFLHNSSKNGVFKN